MATRPGVQEIFSNQTLGSTAAFKYENQESKEQYQISKKKTAAPQPPMKKFGGYKPKILSEADNFLEVERSLQESQESALAAKTKRAPDPSEDRPPAQLTQPKPWIIGDKNVPMVLNTVDDDDDDDMDDDNNNVQSIDGDSHVYNTFIQNDDNRSSRRTNSTSSSASTLIPHEFDGSQSGIDNPALQVEGAPPGATITASSFILQPSTESPLYEIPNGVHQNGDSRGEPDGVFIPPPDYEEDEQTLDFTSEDTDDPSDGGEEGRSKQPKARPLTKVYEGADLSHYLSDDDEEDPAEMSGFDTYSTSSRMSKPDHQRPTVSEKHSLFKTSRSKNKRKNKNSTTAFNSVRNFSYADSKFGTKGKSSGKSLSFTELSDDSELFLNANNRHSSYESFLRTRQGETIPAEANDSGVEMGDDKQNKDDTMWKKLTLRLKNRVSRGPSLKEH